MRNPAPELRKQIFVGDEEFEEAAQKQMQQASGRGVRHPFEPDSGDGCGAIWNTSRATDHYAAQASRSNIGIFINQKDD